MDTYKLIVYTFVVTALWDVTLRYMSLNNEKVPSIINDNMPFIKDLKPYFQNHTLLAAALIAGFVGATTQPIILRIMKFPTNLKNYNYILKFLLLSFIISALYGFIMKASKLFPHLDKYYYEKLGTIKGMYHDGISGLIVQITLLIILSLKLI